MEISLPVSLHTFTHQVPGGSIHAPRVTGGADSKSLKQMNQMITKDINGLIQKQMEENGTIDSMIGTYELKTNERHVLSLSISNYTYMSHYAHGMTIMASLNFDSQMGKLYQLKDLFKPDSDYVTIISRIIQAQIKARQIPLLTDFTFIKPNQDFYIADKSLVIYFQLYEISPYYIGFPMFPVSVFMFQDMLDETGLLARMATSA